MHQSYKDAQKKPPFGGFFCEELIEQYSIDSSLRAHRLLRMVNLERDFAVELCG